MSVYCTFFDSGFLSRGLAMYESLRRHSPNAQLYIFPFDNRCFHVLKQMNLPGVTLVPLNEFEDKELLAVKPSRTLSDYFFTCTSSTILYVLKNFDVPICTYLDADIFFFGDPEVLLSEMKSHDSILLTPHHYAKGFDRTKKSGKYCVQFNSFKKDRIGVAALEWWRGKCLEWCQEGYTKGQSGDQKYLDDWPRRFHGVRELPYLGGGVAGWNVRDYEIFEKDHILKGRHLGTGQEFDVIFYHYNTVRFFPNGSVNIYGARLSRQALRLLYRPYVEALISAKEEIGRFDHSFDPHGSAPFVWSLRNAVRLCKWKLCQEWVVWGKHFL